MYTYNINPLFIKPIQIIFSSKTSTVKNAEGRLKGEDTVLEADIFVGMEAG